ncbi:MAG: TonB-dependent receptor [Bacteroidaceae bacterium]|nr:TonB-dependent receptor [Bacteroidaceae bacterium]
MLRFVLSAGLALAFSWFPLHAQDSLKVGDLHEVVVTGTGTQHLLRDVPVQTEVITAKMLESYGGKSVEEILSGLTASFAFSEGDMGSQMQLGGLGNSYILILIDGKRVHGDVGGENDLGLIDPQNIERIEIVKGAQSALYGSDAMAGVVNIITKKHKDSGLYADNATRYGSYNDLRQHNTLAINIGRFGSQTNFQLQRNDGWQNTAEEWAEGMVLTDSKNKTVNAFLNWQLAERLTYRPVKDVELYAEGTYYKKEIQRPRNGNHPSCDVYTYDLRYNNASASVGGRWTMDNGKWKMENGPLGPKGRLTPQEWTMDNGGRRNYVTFDLDWNKHAYYYDYTAGTYVTMRLVGEEFGPMNGEWYPVKMKAGQSRLQSDQQRTKGELKGVFYLPWENTLNVGTEYRYDYLNAPDRTSEGNASDWTGAVYVQDEFDKLEWLNVTAGVRLVGNQNFGVRLTPKVSTMLSVGDWRLRLGWSQGFKTPTVKELHYRYLHVMGSSTFFNIGNTDLDPQTSNYYSAGLEYRGSRLTAAVTGYVNQLDNMIALVNVDDGEIPKGITTAYLGDGSSKVQARMYKNMDNARTYGVDVTVGYQVMKDLKLNAAYSYLDTEANLYDTSKGKMTHVTIDGTAHHKWNATAMYSHAFGKRYKLGVNLSTRGSSTRYYENNGNGKPYQIWRVNTTHEFPLQVSSFRIQAIRLELGVDNIFNYVDRTMHPYHLGTTSAGTTVHGTVAIRFNTGKNVKKPIFTTKSKLNNNEED